MPTGHYTRRFSNIHPRQLVRVIGPSIVYVPLSKRKFAVIDSEDAEFIGGFRWHANPHYGKFYARTNIWDKETQKCKTVMLHALLLSKDADHIATERTLDNRRANLRKATRAQQCWNRRLSASNTSGYKGVHQIKGKMLWRARISVHGVRKVIGDFHSAELAGAAYRAAAIELHGEFANFG